MLNLPILSADRGLDECDGIDGVMPFMKQDSVRTTVDIPAPFIPKAEGASCLYGRSVRELVLASVKTVLLQSQRPRPKRVQFPLIVSDGPKIDLTNEQIYEHVEFP
jgi:hypothetical protein